MFFFQVYWPLTPINWHPWGTEAKTKKKQTKKLLVGNDTKTMYEPCFLYVNALVYLWDFYWQIILSATVSVKYSLVNNYKHNTQTWNEKVDLDVNSLARTNVWLVYWNTEVVIFPSTCLKNRRMSPFIHWYWFNFESCNRRFSAFPPLIPTLFVRYCFDSLTFT